MLVAALFVFLLLPRLVSDGEVETVTPSASDARDSATNSAAPAARPDERASSGPAASPYADAVEARARAEAQEVLSELIDVRENLEQRGAEEWAAQTMAEISEEAAAGDERYRERDFEAAIGRYQTALATALELEGSLPERFATQLEAIDRAIEALDTESAAAAATLAEQIEPGAPELVARTARIEVLPEVIEAVEGAQAAEAENDLARAAASLQGARSLDGEHEFVAAELERVSAALTEQRFNAAMSEGYAALDDAAFDRAQQRFETASTLKPGSAEASAALQELAGARTAAKLAALQQKSETLAAEENWTDAITVYEEALTVDGSLRFAREGLARARPRAEVDRELTAIIDDPGRLVDNAILGEARGSLERALDVADPGARLGEQIAKVTQIIETASTPLPVRLTSDGLTSVTVFKVARLGTFEEQRLELRPGAYTAVGTRRGYRDVRVEFTVAPGASEAITIVCSEAI